MTCLRPLLFAAILCTPAVGGSIEGRVTNSVTGAGIGDAVLSMWIRTERGVTQQATTDDTGAFRIAGIADGQYEIEVSKDGFFGADIAGPSPAIRVFGDTRFDLKMTPGAGLRGRVLDPEGKPVAGIAVKLGSAYGENTDEKGEFVFKNLPPATFTLSATPKLQPAAKEEQRVVTTYYPSAVDSAQAVPIKIEGVDLFGYDIRLETAAARIIRGVVIDVDGKPAPHATVSVSKPAPGPVPGIATMITMARGNIINWPQSIAAAESVETKEDGTFVFPPLPEGDWSVRAALRPEEGRRGRIEVRVSKDDIDNLEIRLEQPFHIEVTADWGDAPKPAAPPAPLMLVPLDGQQGALSPSLNGFAGRYVAGPALASTPGFYLAAAMLSNRDVLGQVVDLSGPTSLKMIYKTGGGSVRGTVEKGANSVVALIVDETSALRRGYGARCDADGGFVIPDVPPGEYTAVAVRDASDLVGPDFPSLLTAGGKRVTVDAGSAEQVELRVSK